MTGTERRLRVLRTLGLGVSAAALGAAAATPAGAQCLPDPTQANQATTCSGSDPDGIRVTTTGSTVRIPASATVSGTNGPAVAVAIPAATSNTATRTSTIIVAGTVSGGAQAGIGVESGSVPAGTIDFYGTRASVTVAAGGSVTGTSGITVGSSSGNTYGPALVILDNAGTISGTGGVALQSTDLAHGGFDSIANAATGSIGAVVGTVGQLSNAGLIDGGTRSAIDQTTTYNSGPRPGAWTNSGTIRSASTAATIANLGQQQPLTNSGTIANTGTGAAVQGSFVTITNLAGGRITTAGTTAIAATSGLVLTNAGTITGNVTDTPAQGTGFSATIDSTAGTINGNVTLGNGNDLVYARYTGTPTLVTGITGTLDAGAGTNSMVLAPIADLRVATAVTLPSTFQRLRLAPVTGTTLLLASGFVAPGTIEVAGTGTIRNEAAITTNGQAFVRPYYVTGTAPTFVNAGSIQATVAQGLYAVDLGSTNVTNSGTINATGNGVNQSGGALVNTGSIVATGTTVAQFSSSFTNSGLIRSSAGIGVTLSGSVGDVAAVNSGRIEGSTYGAITSIILNNSGTIAATGTGTAVGVSSYGTLNNLAGGVIAGGANAITGADPYGSTSVYNSKIFNAGTINGNVSFVSSQSSSNNANTFVAVTGGVLNGDLALGRGDTLVTDLTNTGAGTFAGINGTVTSNGGLLRYRVAGTAGAVIAPVGPFATAGYELVSGAQLTLTARAPQTQALVLAGDGAVDVSADIATTNGPALSVTSAATVPGTAAATTPGLTITSRGTLSGTTTDYYSGAFGVAVLSNNDTLINEGTIRATYAVTNGGTSYNAAIAFASGVTNNGVIELDGSYGTYNVATVVNTGSIVQTGPRTSMGIFNALSVTNSGTIRTAGTAIQGYYATRIINSGTISSTGAVAIGGGISGGTVVNLGGGTIAGGTGFSAISIDGGMVNNAGTIIGNVNLGQYGGAGVYSADGGTLAGNLTFGSGADLFLQAGDTTGVTGTISAGAGRDIYGRALTSSGTVAIGAAPGTGFEDAMVAAFGTGTVATLTAVDASYATLYAVGDGTVVNQAALTGPLITTAPNYQMQQVVGAGPLGGLTNAGSIGGGVRGAVTQLVNTGTIGSAGLAGASVAIINQSALSFTNGGQVIAGTRSSSLVGVDQVIATNTGTIDGGLVVLDDFVGTGVHGMFAVSNTGTVRNARSGSALNVAAFGEDTSLGGSVSVDNSGAISSSSSTGAAYGLTLSLDGSGSAVDYSVRNAGSIAATTTGTASTVGAVGLGVSGTGAVTGTIINAAGGTIAASGVNAVAVQALNTALVLDNAGRIAADGVGALAIQASGNAANTVRNTGTIVGSIALGDGADSIDNIGTIGSVSFAGGDDRFVQHAGATITGIVDGGAGVDALVIDTNGGSATIGATQIANFDRLTQIGTGTGIYAGSFGVDTIELTGGTLSVAAGQTLATTGATTVTGAVDSGALTILNAGTIAGGINLAAGNDTVANNGTIAGPVQLGAGDDTYVEGAGSVASGGVDGGAGTNLYRVVLAGDRTGIGARANFQNLAVGGTGTLSLALDQSFQSIALTGTNLFLALNGRSVGEITATGAATQLTVDGDVGAVQLGAGNDSLATGAAMLAGRYDGGAGSDTLRLTGASPVTLAGTVTGFETVNLAGGALAITGSLGSTGQALAFAGGDKAITLARGGTLAGAIDLGAGNDSFRLAAGSVLNGTVSGGAGTNAATLDLTGGDLTLRAGALTNFQRVTTEGAGTLTLSGGVFGYDTLVAAGNLTVAADASLATRAVFGPADNRFVIAGGFAGSVDGGAGADSIDVSGGSAAAPTAFTSVANVEAYRMSGGYATVSGTAVLGSVVLSGGRLVGLAGSSMAASGFTVGQGATFGSAGTVTGNVSVAGILSPGASPGTMTVNGNVSLAGSSVSLFEITPAASDKLVVNGSVSIASGATLQFVTTGTLTPGTSLDLVTASGGISGSFTNIVRPASLFGFVVQDATRIRLLGEFVNDAGYAPQARSSIDYINNVLMSGRSSASLIAAVPLLLTTGGTTNQAAFTLLAPQAYAAAQQVGVENGLTLADAARGGAFAPNRDTPGVFTFASALAGTRTLEANNDRNTVRTTTNGYGFLGGIGVAGTGWSLGAFGGYLNDRQTLAGLGVRTNADGAVAGLHGRARYRGLGVKATVAYDDAQARTRRVLPGGSAAGRYDLHSWIADASIDATLPMAGNWSVRPSLGATGIRTTRDGVGESGGIAFALTVARSRDTVAFADGSVTFAGIMGAGTMSVRPYLTIGARYQAEGRTPYALAALGGGDFGLLAPGAPRAPVLAVATLGADVTLATRLSLFGALVGESGDADHRAAGRVGLRLAF